MKGRHEQALEVVGAVRRYLEDLVVFEGPVALAPGANEPLQRPTSAEAMAPDVGSAAQARPSADAILAAASSPGADSALTGASAPSPGDLDGFRQQICDCTRCALAQTRNRFVFGAGDAAAGIMFIGEAPGADEDRQGEPFVGAAGQLLTKIIEAMGLSRDQVYICNVLKCRPPGNRDPRPEEVETCEPHLRRQIQIVQPRIICALGRIAAQALLRTSEPMGRLRGRLHEYAGIPVICTYHPAALLRREEYKRPTWEDIKWLRREYDGAEL